MALDRDLAVAVVRAVSPVPRVGWETNAATGVRGLRLLQESGSLDRFVFSEASARSREVLRSNLAHLPAAELGSDDGRDAPAESSFGYVDVDPYGSPLPYLPSAFRALADGGLLAVTATDLMVLAGPQSSACRRLYGAEPVRGRLGPEGGLRILLATLERIAVDQGSTVRPLLAYVGGHHLRAYLRVDRDRAHARQSETIEPARWTGPSLEGRAPFGPMWLGPLSDPEVVQRLRRPTESARPGEFDRLLARLREESGNVAPFYYEPNRLAEELGLAGPPSVRELIREILRAGYLATRTHVRPEGVRTPAPRAEVEAAARRAVA